MIRFFLLAAVHLSAAVAANALFEEGPRVEYPDWKPLGRGDPLNDPTREYLPPSLERVRYWGSSGSSLPGRPLATTRPAPLPPPAPVLLPPPPALPHVALFHQLLSADEGLSVQPFQSHTTSLPSLITAAHPPPTTISPPLQPDPTWIPAEATTVPSPSTPFTTTPSTSTHSSPTRPVYLIIQGHSKVKKYGANHLPFDIEENKVPWD